MEVSSIYLSYAKYTPTSTHYNRTKLGIKMCLNASFHVGFKRCSATSPRSTFKFCIVPLCFEASTPFKVAPAKTGLRTRPLIMPSPAVRGPRISMGQRTPPPRSPAHTTRVLALPAAFKVRRRSGIMSSAVRLV